MPIVVVKCIEIILIEVIIFVVKKNTLAVMITMDAVTITTAITNIVNTIKKLLR